MISYYFVRANFTDVLNDVVEDSQPLSFASDDCVSEYKSIGNNSESDDNLPISNITKPIKGTGRHGQYRSVEEIGLWINSLFVLYNYKE